MQAFKKRFTFEHTGLEVQRHVYNTKSDRHKAHNTLFAYKLVLSLFCHAAPLLPAGTCRSVSQMLSFNVQPLEKKLIQRQTSTQ